MKSIFNLEIRDLEDYLLSIGGKKYQAEQIMDWLYKKKVFNFNEMTNLSNDLRTKLSNDFVIFDMTIKRKQSSELTYKYLFELSDHNFIEAVIMLHDYGVSICVSSEVGCNMGCAFCESGRLKKVRSLETSEMVEPLLLIENDLGKKIDNVVIMGIGEPFDNYDHVIKFLSIINHPKCLEIGARHITVSTCGLIPKIKEFSELPMQVNLAISLHASNNEIRNKIMPINKVYNIDILMEALKEYITKTNRRVTIEYVMIDSVNDSSDNALELSRLLRGMNVYVNLIPYNETTHLEFKKSHKENIMSFYDILKKQGINVTIRKEFGSTIDAACGQLRAKEVEK